MTTPLPPAIRALVDVACGTAAAEWPPSPASAARRIRPPHSVAYRPDIDGLRAVAVLSVVGYHVGFRSMSGGFVGVDVFFVISGYLICAIIIGELKERRFSVMRFYARRIRRIVPALLVMILAVLALGCRALFPMELSDLSDSAVAAALSVSNIYFLAHTGYFDGPAITKPLLHTWSLAVEEQFYLAFPLVLMAVFRWWPRCLTAALALLWLASFAWSVFAVRTDPAAAFYLPQSRAWELLMGALVANQGWRRDLPAAPRNALAALGVALIAYAVLTYSVETTFPGLSALVPCLGAALIILAGQSGPTAAGRMLSLRPLVGVGLISYSLYLWHWPLIVFQQSNAVLLLGASKIVTRLATIAAALLLAALSWRFVEIPFRGYARSARDRAVVLAGVSALAAACVVAVAIIASGGLPWRYSPRAVTLAGYLDYDRTYLRVGKCFIEPPYRFVDFAIRDCLDRSDDRPNYLLLGDSHAAHLWHGLSHEIPGVNVMQASASGCRPALRQPHGAPTACTALMTYILTNYLPAHPIDRLLISARWLDGDEPGVESVLKWASDRRIPVTLFGPMVEYDLPLPRLLAIAAEVDDPAMVDRHRRDQGRMDAALRSLAAEYGARYVSFHDLLCLADACTKLAPDDTPVEFDVDHLTREGSNLVAQRLLATHQLP